MGMTIISFGLQAKAPEGLFDFAEKVYKTLDVPNVSLDIAFDGESFILFEFQCLRFGTAGIVYSEEYYTKNGEDWVTKKNDKIIEKEYAESVIKYLNSKKNNF